MFSRWIFAIALLVLAGGFAPAAAQSPELVNLLQKASQANREGDLYQATRYYEQVVELTRREFGPEDTNTAIVENNLASLYLTLQRYEAAEGLLLHSRGIIERFFGPTSPNVAIAANNLGAVYAKTGRYEQAAAQYRLALSIWQETGGPNDENVEEMRRRLAELEAEREEARFEAALSAARTSRLPSERQKAALGSPTEGADAAEAEPAKQAEPAEPAEPAARTASPEAPSVPSQAPEKSEPPKVAALPDREAAQPSEAAQPIEAAEKKDQARLRVQVASMKDASRTEAEWQRLKELYAPLLDDLDHQVQAADLGADKGVHHRVFAAPLTQEQADRLCRELKKRKVWCVPQRF
jgi:tetratricopeptide (TPR) repeat protein